MMNRIFITAIIMAGLSTTAKAQNSNPWPTTGNVGIGTSTPVSTLQVAGDVTMNVDVDAQQLTVSGLTDKAKRLTIGYDVNGAGFGYIKSGWYAHQWTNLSLQPNGGNVGIGITNPLSKLQVAGGSLVVGSNAVANNNTDGSISIGNFTTNYTPTSANWGTVGTTLLISALDYSTIGFHDAGWRVDFIRAGNGVIELGYDGGYGKANIGLPSGIWNASGNVGIGTMTPKEALSVNGKIRAKEVKVEIANWPDYVFNLNYELPLLSDIKLYIDKNHHLPDMPSASDVEKEGISLGEMNKLLMKKVEELTLYLIEKDKKDVERDDLLQALTKKLEELKKPVK